MCETFTLDSLDIDWDGLLSLLYPYVHDISSLKSRVYGLNPKVKYCYHWYPFSLDGNDLIIEDIRFNVSKPLNHLKGVGLFAVSSDISIPPSNVATKFMHYYVNAFVVEAAAKKLSSTFPNTIRPAFGYQLCPNHQNKLDALRILNVDFIHNVYLSLVPETSIVGLLCQIQPPQVN